MKHLKLLKSVCKEGLPTYLLTSPLKLDDLSLDILSRVIIRSRLKCMLSGKNYERTHGERPVKYLALSDIKSRNVRFVRVGI